MRRSFLTPVIALICLAVVLPVVIFQAPGTAEAAASLSVSANGSVSVGQTVNVAINVNTGGQAANAFNATLHYPAGLLDGVRGSYSGSICSLDITDASPSGGTADISCGKPSGFTGSGLVATVILQGATAGSGSLSLSDCQVLANDGQGTDITGGCGSTSITVTPAPTAPPTAPPSSTPTPTPAPTVATARPKTSPTPSPTPKPSTTPGATPTPTPGGPAAGVSTANTPAPTPTIDAPSAATLPPSTPTPAATDQAAGPATSGRRSIGQAIKDIFGSLKELKSAGGNLSGIIALLLTMIPILLIAFAIVFFGYRLYILERRRRRTLDRLFELELSELASLEGKLDLLSEKGPKGKQQFKDEFQAVKENILRQIKPEYNKPVDNAKKAEEPPTKA